MKKSENMPENNFTILGVVDSQVARPWRSDITFQALKECGKSGEEIELGIKNIESTVLSSFFYEPKPLPDQRFNIPFETDLEDFGNFKIYPLFRSLKANNISRIESNNITVGDNIFLSLNYKYSPSAVIDKTTEEEKGFHILSYLITNKPEPLALSKLTENIETLNFAHQDRVMPGYIATRSEDVNKKLDFIHDRYLRKKLMARIKLALLFPEYITEEPIKKNKKDGKILIKLDEDNNPEECNVSLGPSMKNLDREKAQRFASILLGLSVRYPLKIAKLFVDSPNIMPQVLKLTYDSNDYLVIPQSENNTLEFEILNESNNLGMTAKNTISFTYNEDEFKED